MLATPTHTHIFLLTVACAVQIQLQEQLFAALPGSPRKPEPGCYRTPLDFSPWKRRMQREAGERGRENQKEREGEGWGATVWSWSRVGNLITNIKNTTERLCHIPTVQLQPGPDSTVINTSYRVAPECTYSTTHTLVHTHAHTHNECTDSHSAHMDKQCGVLCLRTDLEA